MKRYSDREWKSAQNSAPAKANTPITATENKIESTGMTTSSCPLPVCREIRHGSLTPINGAVPNERWATEDFRRPRGSPEATDGLCSVPAVGRGPTQCAIQAMWDWSFCAAYVAFGSASKNTSCEE